MMAKYGVLKDVMIAPLLMNFDEGDDALKIVMLVVLVLVMTPIDDQDAFCFFFFFFFFFF